jgi:hypothetical protein
MAMRQGNPGINNTGLPGRRRAMTNIPNDFPISKHCGSGCNPEPAKENVTRLAESKKYSVNTQTTAQEEYKLILKPSA